MNKQEAAAILGIDTDVSPEEIHRAFRNRSKKHHPDAGGAEEAFQRLLLAKDVLTGNDQPKPDIGMAMTEFLTAFQTVVSQQKDPIKVDLIGKVKDHLERKRGEQFMKQAQVEQDIELTKSLIDRTTYKGGGSDVLLELMQKHIHSAEAMLAQLKVSTDNLRDAIKIATDYGFRSDPPENNFAMGAWNVVFHTK